MKIFIPIKVTLQLAFMPINLMQQIQFEILPVKLLNTYLQQISNSVSDAFDALRESELSADTFSFYTSVSAVFSSKIEGEDIELDSFIKHKK